MTYHSSTRSTALRTSCRSGSSLSLYRHVDACQSQQQNEVEQRGYKPDFLHKANAVKTNTPAVAFGTTRVRSALCHIGIFCSAARTLLLAVAP